MLGVGAGMELRRNTLFPLSNPFLTSPFPSPFTPFTPRDNIKKKITSYHMLFGQVMDSYFLPDCLFVCLLHSE